MNSRSNRNSPKYGIIDISISCHATLHAVDIGVHRNLHGGWFSTLRHFEMQIGVNNPQIIYIWSSNLAYIKEDSPPHFEMEISSLKLLEINSETFVRQIPTSEAICCGIPAPIQYPPKCLAKKTEKASRPKCGLFYPQMILILNQKTIPTPWEHCSKVFSIIVTSCPLTFRSAQSSRGRSESTPAPYNGIPAP